jgi:hypothetical protein
MRKAAIYEMLGWDEGRFDLTLLQVDVGEYADEIGSPSTRLLMEAARRVDESRRQVAVHAPAPSPAPEESAASAP